MTIQEILEAHLSAVAYEGPATCSCEEWESRQTGLNYTAQHRAHVAEVLDKHMQEREAEAWEIGQDSVALHHDIFEASLVYEANPYRMETPNGR